LQEQRILTQQKRKAKTDVLSQCATAILALMQARHASAHRFIEWYRAQLARVEAGELTIPARLEYEDQEMDLPRRPGPDTANIEDLHWRTKPVRLHVTIWRPCEFGTQRFAAWIEGTPPRTAARKDALGARARWRHSLRAGRGRATSYANPPGYFVEVRPGDAMPWFMEPVVRWHSSFGTQTFRQRKAVFGLTVGAPDIFMRALARPRPRWPGI